MAVNTGSHGERVECHAVPIECNCPQWRPATYDEEVLYYTSYLCGDGIRETENGVEVRQW